MHVFGLPSARLAKLRLKEVTIEFLRTGSSVWRFHCPMHGPQAFAIIVAPIFWKASIIPSRSAVARICSEPGLTIKGAATAKCFQLPDGQWKQPDLNPDKMNWYMNLSARLPSYADNH